MSTTAQSNYGSFASSAPAPAPAPTPTPAEDPLGPVELSPGLFYDDTKDTKPRPQTNGIFDTFKRMIAGEITPADLQPSPESLSVSEGTLNPLRIPFVDDAIRSALPDINILDYEAIPDVQTDSSGRPILDSRGRPTFKQDEVSAMREEVAALSDERRRERLVPLAQEFNVGINLGYTSTEISDLIDSKTEMLGPDGQKILYLADTPEQFLNAMERMFGEGKVRMIEDTGPITSFRTAFAPKYYFSVEKDNGEYTDFSPATIGVGSFLNRYAPGVIAETSASLATVPAALSVGATVGMIPYIGPVLAPIAVGYTLYAGAKGAEAGRQYLQEFLGLKGEQLDVTQSFLDSFINFDDAVKEIAYPEWLQDLADTDAFGGIPRMLFTPSDNEPGSTPEEIQQQIAGGIEAVIGLPPAIKSRLKTQINRMYTSGAITQVSGKIDSAVRAQGNVKATQGVGPSSTGEALYLGPDAALESLTVPQVLKNKVVKRLEGLVSQSSRKLDEVLRRQMQSVVTYINKYGDNVGSGNFNSFQDSVNALGTRLKSYMDGAPPDRDAIDRSLNEIGESLNSLDELYLTTRTLVSEGQYKNIFNQLKTAEYDLSDIRNLVSKDIRKIFPSTDAASAPKTRIDPSQVSPTRGEMQFDSLLNEIMSVGTTDRSGRLLKPDQFKKAVDRFKEQHPEFNFAPEDITSPAELLHLYSKRFGDLAVNVFGKEGTPTHNPGRYKQAMEMKQALLDLIAAPRNIDDFSPTLRDEISAANAYVTETYNTVNTMVQQTARITRRGSTTPESGDLATAVLRPGGTSAVQLARNLAEQQRFVNEFLSNPENVQDLISHLQQKRSSKLLTKTDKEVVGPDGAITTETEFGIAKAPLTAFDEVEAYFRNRLDDVLKNIVTTDASVEEAANALNVMLQKEFPDVALRRALGLDEATEEALKSDASLLARLKNSEVLTTIRTAAPGTQFKELFKTLSWDDPLVLRKEMSDLGLVVRREATPEGKTAQRAELRRGLIDYIFSAESGVLTRSSKSGVVEDYNDIVVDGAKLQEIMETLKGIGADIDLLNKQDVKVIDMLAEYASIVRAQMSDAGSALSGAQVVGNLFTLDPRKFASGIARLSTQSRMAGFLANPKVVDAMLGNGRAMTRMEKIQNLFFGKTALGTLAITEALRDDQERDINVQTDELIGSGTATSNYGTFTSSP